MSTPTDPAHGPSSPLSRRGFLRQGGSLSLISAAGLGGLNAQTDAPSPPGVAAVPTTPSSEALPPLVDTQVYLGQWPFRRTPLDQGEALRDHLRAQGVVEAWTGHFDALLHKNIRSVNDRLVESCRALDADLFRPVGCLHPGLPDWRGEWRRCVEVHGMRIIRLHPNYHGYRLDDPEAQALLALSAEAGLLVQIAVIMEEERTLHPLVSVPPTDLGPLAETMGRLPGLRVQLLNAFRTLRGLPLASLAARGALFEIAMLEGVEGIANLLKQIPTESLCFGSYAPQFYFESALLKLRESVLDPSVLASIASGRARALLS